jgi:hypothetical protein
MISLFFMKVFLFSIWTKTMRLTVLQLPVYRTLGSSVSHSVVWKRKGPPWECEKTLRQESHGLNAVCTARFHKGRASTKNLGEQGGRTALSWQGPCYYSRSLRTRVDPDHAYWHCQSHRKGVIAMTVNKRSWGVCLLSQRCYMQL